MSFNTDLKTIAKELDFNTFELWTLAFSFIILLLAIIWALFLYLGII